MDVDICNFQQMEQQFTILEDLYDLGHEQLDQHWIISVVKLFIQRIDQCVHHYDVGKWRFGIKQHEQ